jgi:probable phosphoglycerate mutase
MATTLLLARHGETDDNAALVFQGQGGRGLNRRGRAQAERLADRMKLVRPEAVVSSDLERAVETATIVGRACGLPVRADPELREVDLGRWSGRSHAQVAEEFPEEWAAWSRGLDVRRGGGETYEELASRIERAITRIAEEHAERRILVVSHGGAIRAFVAKMLGIATADGLRALASVGNAAITVIERDGRRLYRLQGWNDMAHLEGLSGDGPADEPA